MSVLFKHQICSTAEILFVSIMVLAHFTTKLYHLSKGFFHRGRCVERAFQAKQLHWCIPVFKDSACLIVPSQCAQTERPQHIYIQALQN